MLVVRVSCNNCGHERLITKKWLESIGINLSENNLYNKIYKLLPRFICSICRTKGAKFAHTLVKNINKKNVRNPFLKNVLKGNKFPSSNLNKTHSSTIRFPKAIPGYTVNASFSSKAHHDREISSKWSKKTCHYCNGTGSNGNCFNCGGTGWEEAQF